MQGAGILRSGMSIQIFIIAIWIYYTMLIGTFKAHVLHLTYALAIYLLDTIPARVRRCNKPLVSYPRCWRPPAPDNPPRDREDVSSRLLLPESHCSLMA